MRRTPTLAVAAVLLAATTALGSEPTRYQDAVGDATGDSPDIVAVTVSEPEGESTIRFDIELAPGRLFGSDMETWTDVLFLAMSPSGEVDERGILQNEETYLTGTHGVTLEMQREAGAVLATPEDMYENLVGFDDIDGTLSFAVEREMIGDPFDLYFQVLLGVERDGAGEAEEMEGDAYPELDDPPALYRVGASD